MTAWTQLHLGLRRDWRAQLLVLGGLASFVLGVYVVAVVGGGWLLSRSSLPDVLPAVVATAVVALAFDAVHRWLSGLAGRVLHTDQFAPFEVLRRFSGAVTGRYAAEDVPAEMARVLAEGTGAAWARVWLRAGDQYDLAAESPAGVGPSEAVRTADPRDDDEPGRRWQEVLHGGELLGVLVVQERPHVRLTAAEERLFAGLAAQAGLALRAAGLRSALEQRARELATRADELRRSRQRLVDAQDDERRRLERDIHDGAQQHLVALAVNLRLAQTLADRDPERAVPVLRQQEDAAGEAVDTLVRLMRGIYPSRLSEEGLVAALEAAAATSTVPVTVTAVGVDRLPPRVEAAAYFCGTEALQNAAKHAQASSVRVELSRSDVDDTLVVCVEDDGRGFGPQDHSAGSGLTNMRERVEALDGSLEITSTERGVRLVARIPLTAAA
jgi:signal transduction histidine kinase